MNQARQSLTLISILSLASSLYAEPLTITLSNTLDFDRNQEMVELDAPSLRHQMGLDKSAPLIVKDAASGTEIPAQLTYDAKLIFQATVKAQSTTQYLIEQGNAKPTSGKVFGKAYAMRADDFAWENDKIAFRAYGPALQQAGERAFGYDVLVKSVPNLIVDNRYELTFGEKTKAKAAELKKNHPEALTQFYRDTSFHIDHGNGMDFYNVGPTLGSGTAALMDGDKIIYPYCYKSYEILDSGPLRITFKLTFPPLQIKGKKNIIETRIITLDAGTHFNKTRISYKHLEETTPILAALVMREPAGEANYLLQQDGKSSTISYETSPKLTSSKENGVVYVAAIYPQAKAQTKAIFFSPEESRSERAGATGHVAIISDYQPHQEWIYYWGAAWSKYGFANLDEWNTYVKLSLSIIENPLTPTK